MNTPSDENPLNYGAIYLNTAFEADTSFLSSLTRTVACKARKYSRASPLMLTNGDQKRGFAEERTDERARGLCVFGNV